jgi:hypothetical protein
MGILLSADEPRNESPISRIEWKYHVAQAVENWSKMHEKGLAENTGINFIAYPVAAYIRLSLQVPIKSAIAKFMNKDFEEMRALLRSGNLLGAARHALDGLSPWAMNTKNQVLMISTPCGKFTVLRVVRNG